MSSSTHSHISERSLATALRVSSSITTGHHVLNKDGNTFSLRLRRSVAQQSTRYCILLAVTTISTIILNRDVQGSDMIRNIYDVRWNSQPVINVTAHRKISFSFFTFHACSMLECSNQHSLRPVLTLLLKTAAAAAAAAATPVCVLQPSAASTPPRKATTTPDSSHRAVSPRHL